MFTAASTIAISPTVRVGPLSVEPVTMIAPSRITPWIALAPDISGVCSVEDTLEITSMPTNTLRMKIVSQTTASSITALPLLQSLPAPCPRSGAAWARVGSRRRG